MVKKITSEMPIRKVGTSMYLLLDKNIRDSLAISYGTILKVTMENINSEEVKCPRCHNIFCVDESDDVVDCPACDNTIIESDKEVVDE